MPITHPPPGAASPCLLFRVERDGNHTVELPGGRRHPIPYDKCRTLADLAQFLHAQQEQA